MADNPLITQGATITELSELFGIDRKEVRHRISSVSPHGKRGQSEVWRVRDVAPKLIKLDDSMTDLVSQVLATHHTDLPKMLSKEYWYGQNQRIRFLREINELWDTSYVVTLCGDVFKTLRLSLMLSADTVEREAGLTVKQRDIIGNLIHQALFEAREKLVVSLIETRKDSRGKAFAPQESTIRLGPRALEHANGEPQRGDPDYL